MSKSVPEGWSKVLLGELCLKVANGVSCQQAGNTHGIPVTRIETIATGVINYDKIGYANPDERDWEKFKLDKGDILFSHINSVKHIAKVACYKGERALYHGMNLLNIRPDPCVDSAFLFYYLSQDATRKHFQTVCKKAINQASLNTKDIKSLNVACPPLLEQKKIAVILNSVDETISATQAVIDQTRKVKEGLLQDLLTRGIGHTRFKQTEIGEIPEEWELRTLGEVVLDISTGVSVNSENRIRLANEKGVLKTSCVSNGQFNANEHKAVLAKDVARLKCPVVADRIIISRMNTPLLVGECGYIEKDNPDLFLPDRLWSISVNSSICHCRWLNYLLSSPHGRKLLTDNATGTSGSMKNISKAKLTCIVFSMPPLQEQVEYINILSNIDDLINKSINEKQHLESLKNGLMQDLLSGEVRVAAS